MHEDTPSGWASYEAIVRDRRIFWNELARQDDPGPAIRKMLMVEAHGWPAAMRALKYTRGEKGGKLIVRSDGKKPEIWILKCKPSCWRLYFYVYKPPTGAIAYLHAVCKRKDASDPSDAAQARTTLGSLLAGAGTEHTGIRRLKLQPTETVRDPRVPPQLGQ